MINIGKKLKEIESIFPVGAYIRHLEDPRSWHLLFDVRSIIRLLNWMFTFLNNYSLHSIEEYLKGLTTMELYTLSEKLKCGELSLKEKEIILKKIDEKEPLISDSQIRRVLSNIDLDPRSKILPGMVKKARRNKTWKGRKIAVYDGTAQGKSNQKLCPYCRSDSKGSFYHKELYLVQVNSPPFMIMDYELLEEKVGESTGAKKMARRQIRDFRGAYADLVLLDGAFLGREFIQIHTSVGMDVLCRIEQKNPEKLPQNMLVFREAKENMDLEKPDLIYFDEKQKRTVRIWNGGEVSWSGVDHPLFVLRFEFVPEGKGSPSIHWVLTTLNPEEEGLVEIYKLTILRWRIENNTFRQEKSYGEFNHKQTHDKDARGLRNFRILAAIAYNIRQWMGYRNLTSISERFRKTSYGMSHFQKDLIKNWTIWLYEEVKHRKRVYIDARRGPPVSGIGVEPAGRALQRRPEFYRIDNLISEKMDEKKELRNFKTVQIFEKEDEYIIDLCRDIVPTDS